MSETPPPGATPDPSATPGTPPPEGAAAPTEPPATLRCARCGAEVPPDADWCLECGLAARTRIAPTPRWRVPVFLAAGLSALALAAMAVAFVDLTKDEEPTAAGTTAVTTAPPPATAAPPATTTPPATTVPTAPTTTPTGPLTVPTGPATTPTAPTTTPTAPTTPGLTTPTTPTAPE